MLLHSWRKVVPDLVKDGLQGFPNKKIIKSEILDMVCLGSFENINEDEEWLQSDACELSVST
jgi:hypothetical protein